MCVNVRSGLHMMLRARMHMAMKIAQAPNCEGEQGKKTHTSTFGTGENERKKIHTSRIIRKITATTNYAKNKFNMKIAALILSLSVNKRHRTSHPSIHPFTLFSNRMREHKKIIKLNGRKGRKNNSTHTPAEQSN